MTGIFPHLRATLILGLPLIGSHLAQIAITAVDTLMLGWYGVAELAALSLAGPFFFSIFIFGAGFALAVMPMVATAVARDERKQVRRVTRMGLWIAALFGAATLPIFWFSEPIMRALGQEAVLSADVQAYLRIVGWGMGLSVMGMVLKSHLSALEHTQVVLWSTVIATLLNTGLNWIFIFGNLGAPEMGLEGAALASLITHLGLFAMLAAYCLRGPDMAQYALFTRLWRPDAEAFWRVFRLGWPIGLTQLAESGLFAAAAVMMGWIGPAHLAAHGIALQIASITFMIHVGLSSAATVRAGRAWGLNDGVALRHGAFAALILSGVTVAMTIAVFLGLPEPLIGLFLDPENPGSAQIVAIGIGFLAAAALFQLADAAQVLALGLLRGLQDTRMPMIYAILSYWVIGVPASYVLGIRLGFGGQGIWLGLVIGLAVAGALMMWRFWSAAARVPAT